MPTHTVKAKVTEGTVAVEIETHRSDEANLFPFAARLDYGDNIFVSTGVSEKASVVSLAGRCRLSGIEFDATDVVPPLEDVIVKEDRTRVR
jgi:hypothetical protein